jgi:periplasmic protein CpxP/Spy
MMCDLPRPFVCTLAVATCLGSIGFVGLSPAVSWAQGAVSGPSDTVAPPPGTGTPPGAPGTGTPPAPPMPKNGARPPALDPMAQRINYLHKRLRITRAQEPLWAGVAQVMRDNATALAPLLRQQFQATQGGDAIDMLSAGENLDAAQLEGLRKFIDAFQPLYDSMPDAQKKIADYVFRRSQASEEPATPSTVLPTYSSAPPPEDYAAILAYPAYPPVYAFPDYSPLFVAPFIGIVVGPRFFFHGHPDFHHPDFHHPDFQHLDFHHFDFHQPGIHTLPPLTHVGGGLGRVAAPSFRR